MGLWKSILRYTKRKLRSRSKRTRLKTRRWVAIVEHRLFMKGDIQVTRYIMTSRRIRNLQRLEHMRVADLFSDARLAITPTKGVLE